MVHVTLVNRTNQTLQGVWDGRHYDITPGKHSFPEIMAMKFRDQNPIMGTQNPQTLEVQYKVGIVEMNDDISPIDVLPDNPMGEKFDSSKVPGAATREVLKGDGVYNPFRDSAPKLPTENAWVKP